MATQDTEYPGQAHGKASPLRWDPSTAAAVMALGALLFLAWVNLSFSASANIGRK